MKKNIILVLTLSCLLFSVVNKVSAEESLLEEVTKKDLYEIGETSEPRMPISSGDKTVELSSERKDWVLNVIEYNEEYYSQNLKRWYENEDFIVFEFYPISKSSNNTQDFSIHKIEYLKPESYIMNAAYQTKMIYYGKWDPAYYKQDKKSANTFYILASLVMLYTPTTNKLAGWVFEQVLGNLIGQVDKTRPVSSETYNKYYYYNKAAAVYIAGVWLPRVYIGSRRSLAWGWATYHKSNGEPMTAIQQPKEGIGIPPVNYDGLEYKNRFYDTAWMFEEAIRRAYGMAYVDVFYQTLDPIP